MHKRKISHREELKRKEVGFLLPAFAGTSSAGMTVSKSSVNSVAEERIDKDGIDEQKNG